MAMTCLVAGWMVVAAASTGASVTLSGPASVALEIRAQGKKPKQLEVVLTRDARFESRNKVKLTPKKPKKPKENPGFLLMTELFVEVAAGTHTYVITSGAEPLLVQSRVVKKIPKKKLAAPEREIAPATPEKPAEKPVEPVAVAVATPPVVTPPEPSTPPEPALAPLVAPELTKLTALAPPPSPPPDERKRSQILRVAVYDFELSNVEKHLGTVVTDSVLSEVRKLAGVSAIGMDEIRDMLSHESNKQVLGCESNESCLAEIAGALGVDELVSGKLAKLDDGGTVFLARRIDQAHAKVMGTVNRRLKDEQGQEFLAAIGPAMEELFPSHDLKPGMKRGVPEEMALRLDPPPLPRWSVFGVAGGAVAALAAGGFFGMRASADERSYNEKAEASRTALMPGSSLVSLGNRAEQNAQFANIGLISAAGLAITAGVMALFTDWHGYADAAAAKP